MGGFELAVRDERVRRIAKAAAYGGGGLLGVGTALTGAATGLMYVQAQLARRAVGTRRTVPPYADGRYVPVGHTNVKGTSIRMVVIGDSGAAGLGCEVAQQTPGGIVAQGVANALDRAVRLTVVADVGARSRGLAAQVTRALHVHPQLAVVMIGGNDITHLDRPQTSVRFLSEAVGRLRDTGCEVVIGTCPDLSTVPTFRRPLRDYAGRASRELAAAQGIGAAAAGGHPVPLAHLLAPTARERPEEFFGADGFHPSPAGYAACGAALLPVALAALGHGERSLETQAKISN